MSSTRPITEIINQAKTSIINARTIISNPIVLSTINQIFGANQGGDGRNGIPPYLPPERIDADGNPITYGDVQQKSSHNSYLRDETILGQFNNQNITSFELDIHNGDPGINFPRDNYAENGDFYVYHDSLPSFGNMGSDTHYPHLTDGLADIVAINTQNPNHDVLTLHIDVKDMLDSDRGLGPEDLDRLLRQELEGMLYTPGDLIEGSGSNNLVDAYGNTGMPSLDDLEGRVMIVLTGDTEVLNAYQNGVDNPVGFISANPEFDANGNFIPDPNAVFYNIPMDEIGHADQILDEDFIVRAYGANDANSYQEALDSGVHHIGTDYISPGDDTFQTSASNDFFHTAENVGDAFGEAKDWTVDQAANVGGAVADGAVAAGGAVVDGANAVGGAVADGAGAVADGAVAVGGAVVDGAGTVGGAIADGAGDVGGAIADGISSINPWD